MRVNYISNLALSETSGGWSGINVAIHEQLAKDFDVRFGGPINPGNDYPEKLISKLQRLNGRPGAFHFFSDHRLQKIANLVEQSVDRTSHCDFFHGQTPWILYQSPRPYFVYTDACFATYLDVYHDRSRFMAADLERICKSEARWLSRAAGVFFGTRWALERTVDAYRIPRSNLAAVGTGGAVSSPDRDAYEGGMNFLFIALDFDRKGGRICVDAFKMVRAQFPQARLTIAGERPPDDVLKMPGVSFEGFLSKSVPSELQTLKHLYAEAFMLIHPTSSDIQPLVISEAGYYGCPAISARSFGIPEMIRDGVTGILVDSPLTAKAFSDRIVALCKEKVRYLSMRQAVRAHSTQKLTWRTVGDAIIGKIKTASVPANVR